MKKLLVGAFVLIAATVAVAGAGLQDSPLFKEYTRRSEVKYTGYAQAVLTVLSFKGMPWEKIAEFKADEATGTFEVKTQTGELCKGTYVDRAMSYSCENGYSTKQRRILAEIGSRLLEDTVIDIEFFDTNFVFQTGKNLFCRGSSVGGTTEFTCYSKAGLVSFTGSGDSD